MHKYKSLRDHVIELARRHNINVYYWAKRDGQITIYRSGRRSTLKTPRITNDIAYFIALHEIAHKADTKSSFKHGKLEREANAWLWAMKVATILPNAKVMLYISKALRTYHTWAKNRQHFRKPPRIPKYDSAFWDLLDRDIAWYSRLGLLDKAKALFVSLPRPR